MKLNLNNMRAGALGTLLAMSVAGKAEEGLPKINWSGDLRYRHEEIRVDNATDRYRDRIRLRLGLSTELDEQWSVIGRFATGENSNESAISTNQTLSEAGGNKAFWVDMAYFRWQPRDGAELRLGKMENLWWQPSGHQLVFDEDYTPEGLGARWSTSKSNGQLFILGQAQWIAERSSHGAVSDSTDAGLLGVQAGFKKSEGENPWTAAFGLYSVTNIEGHPAIRTSGFGGNSSRTVGATSVYDEEFNVGVFGYELKLSSRPLGFTAEAVANFAASDANKAFAVGAHWGTIKAPKDWKAMAIIRYAERDSLLAGLADSDVAGPNDSRGITLQVKYGLTKRITIGASHLAYHYLLSSSNLDYRRTQIDFAAKF